MNLPLRGTLAGLLATAVLLILLIAAGVFDPKPVGQLQTSLPQTSLRIIEPGQTIVWLDELLPAGAFSVRGTAVLQSGNPDSGVGLALGSQADAFVVAVSPLGTVLVQQRDEVLLSWQPWPHVRLDDAPNEIWIDLRGNALTVRLNRELLWQGEYLLATRRIGLFGEGFGGETAVYTFLSLEQFSP
ncbi:MAG: hypothetical protein WAS33_18280 [Candidatus Promineifilaceae bacterium]|nr:hypothetical protein [Anaerolineaceae bacterium]